MVLKMLTQCAKGFVLILDNIWDLACFKRISTGLGVLFLVHQICPMVAPELAHLLAMFSVLSRYLLVCTRVHALEVS